MTKSIKNLSFLAFLILITFLMFQPSSSHAKENIKIIEGKIIDIHILGQREETVKICHFDPRFVVVLETINGIERLAIHSPVRTFVDANPIGNSYKFTIERDQKAFIIKSINKVNP